MLIKNLFSRRSKLLQAGDTIVEVLIATTVVSVVLVGSFTIANASLKQIRMAQERSAAQKVAQAAVESINAAVAADPTKITAATVVPFCPPEGCTPTGSIYTTSISRPGTTPTFVVRVSWDGLHGKTEEVVIHYRVKVTSP